MGNVGGFSFEKPLKQKMAERAKALLRKIRLKPSTTLWVSRTAIFVLLGLISAQTASSALLWYAKHVKASSGLQLTQSYLQGSESPDAGKFITIDHAGNMYLYSQATSTVRKYDSTGTYAGQVGASGSGPGEYGSVSGMAVDSTNNLYVLDADNLRVVKFSSSGSYSGTTWGSYGSDVGQFGSFGSIAISSTDYIYITDLGNSRVQKFDTAGEFKIAWGSAGSGSGQFSYPYGITTDSSGAVYVSEGLSGRIQKFGPSGGAPTLTWTVPGVWGGYMATGPSDNIHVTSLNAKTIYRYNTAGSLQNSWGGSGSGAGTFGGSYFDGTIATDGSGNVYVADYWNYQLQKFSATGSYLGIFQGSGTAVAVTDVAVDSSGYLYTVMAHSLKKTRISDGRLMWVVGSSRSSDPGLFSYPEAVDVSPDGSYVYVLDWGGNGRVEKFTSDGVFCFHLGCGGSR